tara:strand:- start:310 stop:594 length:285 start_codon:yes stop_codon:yes gene_type:complete
VLALFVLKDEVVLMNMISKLRLKFTSGNAVPVTRVTITAEEYDKLQMEWITRSMSKEAAQKMATDFAAWWHNQQETDIEQGFQEWWQKHVEVPQ